MCDVARSRSPRSRHLSQSSRTEWLEKISTDWTQLSEAPEVLRNDPEVVGSTMRESGGQSLQYASEELRSDREYLLGAAQELGVAVLQHAMPSLRADREFVMEVVDYCSPGEVLPFVSGEVRAELLTDREFVLEAVRENGVEVLQDVDVALLSDKEFMLSVTEFCPGGEALQFASHGVREELFADRDFVLQTVRSIGADVLEDASMSLRSDRAFILECADESSLEEVVPYASSDLRAELDPEGKIAPHVATDCWDSLVLDPPDELIPEKSNDVFNHAGGIGSQTQEIIPCKARPTSSPNKHSNGKVMPLPPWRDPSHSTPVDMLSAPTFVLPVPKRAPHPTLLSAQPLPQPEQGLFNQRCQQVLDSSVAPSWLTPSNVDSAGCGFSTRPPALADSTISNGTRIDIPIGATCSAGAAQASSQPDADGADPMSSAHTDDIELIDDSEDEEIQEAPLQEDAADQFAHRAAMLQSVRDFGTDALAKVPADLRGDRDFMTSVSVFCAAGDVLRYTSDLLTAELLADRTFAMKLIKESGASCLARCSKELRTNRTFMLAAAAYCDVSEVLWYASSKMRSEMYTDRGLVARLVQQVGANGLVGASEELRNDREFFTKLSESHPISELMVYAGKKLRADRDFILKGIRNAGASVLSNASEELRGDRTFMLQIAASHPLLEVLTYASKELLTELSSDRDFLIKAVKDHGSKALAFASADLRGDLGFMFEVVALCPPAEAWSYASEELREENAESIDL